MTGGPDSLRPGELVAGKFRVERMIGRGGMGFVVAATNVQLGQRIALKFLATGVADPEATERFTKEARAAAKLRSEHVARVYDVGADPERGPFIVMELLDGSNLAEVVAKSGRLPIQRAAEYVIDACEGLSEAHARGIIHQDIKPANLFVTTGNDGKPQVKVLDFGIARVASAAPTKDSKGNSQGSPHYLAPEQLRASPQIDRRVDLWALGCVLHELVTGERAFKASRFVELVATILEGKRSPLPSGLHLPPELAAVIARCLELDPTRRFNSSGELAIALLPLARRRAHAVAAMAVARVREAGIDPRLQMPASLPPPAEPESSDPIIDLHSSSKIPRATPLPVITIPNSAPPRTDTPMSLPPSTATAAPPEPSPRGRVLMVALPIALLLAATGVGVAVWKGSATTNSSIPAQHAQSAIAPSSTPSAASSSAPPATVAEPSSSAGSPPVTSAVRPVVPVATHVRAVTQDAGAGRSTSTPKGPTGPGTSEGRMDIERNR